MDARIKSGHDDRGVCFRLTDGSWHGRFLSEMAYFPQFRTRPLKSLTRDAADETGRHCERSEAIHRTAERKNGFLRRYARRNDGPKLCSLTAFRSGSQTSGLT